MTASLAPLLWALGGLLAVCTAAIVVAAAAGSHRVVWRNPDPAAPAPRPGARRAHPERKLYLVPPPTRGEAAV